MVYLAFIFHMHQPYYTDILTRLTHMPWVRLHGTKDYLDMVRILEKYPDIHQTFNFVPSLLEQVEDYATGQAHDIFWDISYKPAGELTREDKDFIRNNFFMINKDKVISFIPRYYDLYLKRQALKEYSLQDYLDLQVWFNLAWIDPGLRDANPLLKQLVNKARFYSEEDKRIVLDSQIAILEDIIPEYKKFIQRGQVEVSITPYYHPILPLLYNTSIAKEANKKSPLPRVGFSYPEDASAQINSAVDFFQARFGSLPQGMWPSEEAVSEHVVPFLIQAGIKWIVADEGVLFKSLRKKKRDTRQLYSPHLLKREEGELTVIFRDRNISDLIGFEYQKWLPKRAAEDFLNHMKNINNSFKGEDVLVTVAMDGENAWEYYHNDGHDFLNALYQQLCAADFVKTTTVQEYLSTHRPKHEIKRLAAGSWIYGEFGKWIGNPHKVKAWEWLAAARNELESLKSGLSASQLSLAWKQMYILEGSDWFWWYGEDPEGNFDRLYRLHMTNFYLIIGKEPPGYLKAPLTP